MGDINIRLADGLMINYIGDNIHYLNWLDTEGCFIVIYQHNEGGPKGVAKYPHHNVAYFNANPEPEVFDYLKDRM